MVNEWWELADRFPLELAALVRGEQEVVHPAAARLLPRVRFLAVASAATAASNAATLVRSPGRYARTLAEVLRGSFRRPAGGTLKGAAVFWESVHLARVARRLGVVHLHAHFLHHPATAAWVVHRIAGTSFSVTAHADDLFIGPALFHEKLRDARFVATISEYNRAYLHDVAPGEGRVEIVRCGVRTEDYAFRERAGVSAARLRRPARAQEGTRHPAAGLRPGRRGGAGAHARPGRGRSRARAPRGAGPRAGHRSARPLPRRAGGDGGARPAAGGRRVRPRGDAGSRSARCRPASSTGSRWRSWRPWPAACRSSRRRSRGSPSSCRTAPPASWSPRRIPRRWPGRFAACWPTPAWPPGSARAGREQVHAHFNLAVEAARLGDLFSARARRRLTRIVTGASCIGEPGW